MEFTKQREELISLLKQQGITDENVLDAIDKIPRHKFIPKELEDQAYGNYPLPIEKGQTISQPYTVAFMLQLLELKKEDKVLEIGAGSGWNAALISHIISPKGKVYTTEFVKELAKSAKENLKSYKNVKLLEIDGSKGYEKESPYDKIIITAAAPEIPKPLIEQLKEKGIIVAPIGPEYQQQMIKAIKIKGKLEKQFIGYFAFVPLKGKYGYKK